MISEGEEALNIHLQELGIPFVREYKFSKRKWQADFAYPERKILVEVEGGTKPFYNRAGKLVVGRHSKGKGFDDDCEKYNEAQRLGWKVYRFSTSQVNSEHAKYFIEKVLND
jgi:very-short-patch-repair endonuclease